MQLIRDSIDFSKYNQPPPESANVKPASQWCDAVIDRLYGQSKSPETLLPWSKTHPHIALRSGEVSIWAGINGHGKSILVSHVMLATLAQNERVLIASMEMKPEATMARMARQAARCREPSIAFIKQFHAWTDEKLWLYDQQGTVKSDRILAVGRYAAEELHIKHFVIDSLMKCGIGVDDYNRQKVFIDQLCAFAKDTGVHVHLVAHSRKGESEKAGLDKFDIKGASEISDQVDNVFLVWRNKRKEDALATTPGDAEATKWPDALLTCAKQRHGEWEGRINLWFHRDSFQFSGDSRCLPIDHVDGDAAEARAERIAIMSS